MLLAHHPCSLSHCGFALFRTAREFYRATRAVALSIAEETFEEIESIVRKDCTMALQAPTIVGLTDLESMLRDVRILWLRLVSCRLYKRIL